MAVFHCFWFTTVQISVSLILIWFVADCMLWQGHAFHFHSISRLCSPTMLIRKFSRESYFCKYCSPVKQSWLGCDLPISINDRRILPFCEDFQAKIKPLRKFSNSWYIIIMHSWISRYSKVFPKALLIGESFSSYCSISLLCIIINKFLTHNAPIATKVVCFSRLLIYLRSL